MLLAIIQARVSSSRLPGKVLKPILGKPMLALQIERIQRSHLIENLVIATSDNITDNSIEDLCKILNVECFRGSLEDVLDRFYQAAKPYSPDHVIRLTGDCPLCDPELIDKIIRYHLMGDFDYTSNTIDPTYPDGLDGEILRYNCLEKAWNSAQLDSQREHVTPFIYQNPELFKIGSYKNSIDLSYLRWTVDELVDFQLISQIYTDLYPKNANFTTENILEYLEINPDLKTINSRYQRNAGFLNL
ncbi:cytidylyltransferase domain-containing protein [Crocosphaera watsonii]|uniref:N-Acetylneuraminate cytidylyltransferase n=1 Tax=Crocosphaera watsonii WH 0401 TaxID=555881 RepID=T2J5Q2_CROWT|nr:glycosyltransferase family protein [Crocosphaera watsonii]CCQ59832.1 N-Acetylneuraminate cytidylyltransferase [Crocosphaera watsonii WH 0401]